MYQFCNLIPQSVTLYGISVLLSQYLMCFSLLKKKGSRGVLIHMHVVIRRIDITAKISHVPADCSTSISGHQNNTQRRKAPASVPWRLGPKKEHQITLYWDFPKPNIFLLLIFPPCFCHSSPSPRFYLMPKSFNWSR